MDSVLFPNPLRVELLPDGETRKLTSTFIYTNPTTGLTVEMEPGFETNYGSVPKFLRGFISAKTGSNVFAFSVHDALYASGYLSKDDADIELDIILEYLGMNSFKRFCILTALTLGGEKAWDACREKGVESKVHCSFY